jgi:hypothetical protein
VSKVFDFLQLVELLTVSFDIEFFLVSCDDFAGVNIFFFELLVMRTALESISGSNEFRHFFIELVGSE